MGTVKRPFRRRMTLVWIGLLYHLLLANSILAIRLDDNLANLDTNFDLDIAAVFSKVAYGSTTTTKRSIPENVLVPSVTTVSTPILTTAQSSSTSVSSPKAGKIPLGGGAGVVNGGPGSALGKKLNENIDDDLMDIIKTDDGPSDPRKKHYEMLDTDRGERVLPTLPSNADILKTNHNNGNSNNNNRHHHGHQAPNRNYLNSTPMPPHLVNGNKNGNNNLPPSYSPPSRSFFTPPLPPEYQNPFADKPTLRGTQSENSLLLLQQSHSPQAGDFNHHSALNRRPNVAQQHEKKVLNTPSNTGGPSSSILINQLNHFLLSTTAHPAIQNHSHQNGNSGNNVLHIPSISRILSGSNGRKEDIPAVLLRQATVKPNLGKFHTTTAKVKNSTTNSSSSSSMSTLASPSPTTVRSFLGKTSENEEENTEEIELDEQLNKNLLVLVNKNEDEDSDGGEGESNKDEDNTDDVIMEPSDAGIDGNKKMFDKNFMSNDGGDNLWSILWNFHIYLTAILFTIISVYSIFKIIFYDKLIYLFNQNFFLMIYCLIITISLIRIYYLCYDPYNINSSFNFLLNDFFLNFPQFLMTVLLVLLIYYLIVKIYFNDLLLLVSGGFGGGGSNIAGAGTEWDSDALIDAGETEKDGIEEEEHNNNPDNNNFKRITLDKKNKIILVEGNNTNSGNTNNAERNEEQGSGQEQSPASSPENNFYRGDFVKQQKDEKELDYHGFYLVYFVKNFYKKNARFFNVMLAVNVALLLVFITLFIVFFVRLQLTFNVNLLLIFVKFLMQFLNLNFILMYFYIYKKLKQLLIKFKLKIINLINCSSNSGNNNINNNGDNNNVITTTTNSTSGDKSNNCVNNSNKVLLSEAISGNENNSAGMGPVSTETTTYGRGGGTNHDLDHQHEVNSNTNLVRTFQRSFNLKKINYLIFIKNLFNAINITIGIIMLYLLFIIINLLYFTYYYYYYYVNADEGNDNHLQHNNLIFDKEKLNNIFLIKFNWLEWSYQFSNRLIELTILILFIWVLNIKFISNSRRLFSKKSSLSQNRDELIDTENFILNLNLNKNQVVSYNTNNNQVEFNTNVNPVMGQTITDREDILMDNEYENPINIYQQLANSQGHLRAGQGAGPYYGVNKNYQGYYQEPVGTMVTPGIPMMINPSNTTIFNSINVRNNEFRASKNLKQFKSTNSLSSGLAQNPNNYRPPQPQHMNTMGHPYQHHPMGPHTPGHYPGHNFYDVINPNSNNGSNYYYSLRNSNPNSGHSSNSGGNNNVDGNSDSNYRSGGSSGGGDCYDQQHSENPYNMRSMKKGASHSKSRARKKKTNPMHRHHDMQQQHRTMMSENGGILPGLLNENAVIPGGDSNFDVDPDNVLKKQGNGNKMLVDDNGFVRFKEFEERNNDSGINMANGSDYNDHQQHPNQQEMGGNFSIKKKNYNQFMGGQNVPQPSQRTPYHHHHPHQQQMQHNVGGGGGMGTDPDNQEFDDFLQ